MSAFAPDPSPASSAAIVSPDFGAGRVAPPLSPLWRPDGGQADVPWAFSGGRWKNRFVQAGPHVVEADEPQEGGDGDYYVRLTIGASADGDRAETVKQAHGAPASASPDSQGRLVFFVGEVSNGVLVRGVHAVPVVLLWS